MIRRLPLVPLLLCALFAVTSVTMAAARGMVATGQAVVICSGYGVVTILVDDKGEPVGTVHPCPDCVAQLLVDLPPQAAVVAWPVTPARAVVAEPCEVRVACAHVRPAARAPPVV